MQGLINQFFNKELVSLVESNQSFYLKEREEEGAGFCYFVSDKKVLKLVANNKTLLWCLNKLKRAEGSFIVLDDNMQPLSLHLIEMKMILKKKELSKAIEQIKGMYLISMSVMAFLGIKPPNEIKAYIAYSELKLSENTDDNSIVGNKPLVGVKESVLDACITDPVLEIWNKSEITLHHGKVAKLIKGQRTKDNKSDNFNYDFGRV